MPSSNNHIKSIQGLDQNQNQSQSQNENQHLNESEKYHLFNLAMGSRFVQRLRRRYENHLPWLPKGAPTHDSLLQALLIIVKELQKNNPKSQNLQHNLEIDSTHSNDLNRSKEDLNHVKINQKYIEKNNCNLNLNNQNNQNHSNHLSDLNTNYHHHFEGLPNADLGSALRILRQLLMERLVVLDCEQSADLNVITNAVTHLAELALDVACVHAQNQLDLIHGKPLLDSGERAQMWVIGMGKLGARELNVSSDIDLIYIFDHDGETTGLENGRGKITIHEYFARAVKIIYNLIGENTEHGFVFRVDLALRPHGNSGPPVMSLSALEHYLQSQGREWERFAWMKSRVIAPRSCFKNKSVQSLRGVVLPFVFRRYLDYGVFDALRSLHQQIRDQSNRKSAGRPERQNDVKLSRGGIREIEFTVQLLQVVRGGQFPELRARSTMDALARLAQASLMPQETALALQRAYVFLRQVEHRIQYLDDQQTHLLPSNEADLLWIAQTMAYSETASFLRDLAAHRETVAQEFETLLHQPEEISHSVENIDKNNTQNNDKNNSKESMQDKGKIDISLNLSPTEWDALIASIEKNASSAFLREIQSWQNNQRIQALRDAARIRLIKLIYRTQQWLDAEIVSENAVLQFLKWLETLLRRESYFTLLLERPSVHLRLLNMLGAARWPAKYLQQHPSVIDELADPEMLDERFVPADFENDLERRLISLQNTKEDDDETLLDLLRRAVHSETFRTLARDVEGKLSVEQVADDLSALADSTLRVTSHWCWKRLKNRHTTTSDEAQFAIISYGKLGGKELGYGSDLDIVFLYQDEDERAQEVYAALVRKLINWLTVKTGEGDLYEIDTALRPNGNSGLLVTSFSAFAKYQQQRGSNTAWTWEHQAMTRARFVIGSVDLKAQFDEVRKSVIVAPRDFETLKKEITQMRERVAQANPIKSAKFDVKHSSGAMLDAEFAVQYLVLAHSAKHPELIDNVGNIALLQRAEKAGLLEKNIGESAAKAYRKLRHIQHRARLNEEPMQVSPESIQAEKSAIDALWNAVFEH